MERSLLIETVCGLADIALVKRTVFHLRTCAMTRANSLKNIRISSTRFYDRYEAVLANMDWTNCLYRHGNIRREIIEQLEKTGYSRVDIDTDSRAAKTFYTNRGGVHINGTENLSFHIVPPQDSFGLGRFAICATRNGESSQLGTDHAPFFFRRLLAFLKGERKENEIIDEISTDRKTE